MKEYIPIKIRIGSSDQVRRIGFEYNKATIRRNRGVKRIPGGRFDTHAGDAYPSGRSHHPVVNKDIEKDVGIGRNQIVGTRFERNIAPIPGDIRFGGVSGQ